MIKDEILNKYETNLYNFDQKNGTQQFYFRGVIFNDMLIDEFDRDSSLSLLSCSKSICICVCIVVYSSPNYL